MRKASIVFGLLFSAVVLVHCSSSSPLAPAANVRVFLTDAPLDLSGVSAVNVTLSQVLLFPEGVEEDGAILLDFAGQPAPVTVNLLDFQDGRAMLLAEGEVPPGRYLKIRLVVASAELVRDEDGDPATPPTVDPIFVPSDKVDVPRPFTLSAGEGVDLTLDFDAKLSVQVNSTPGQPAFILRPVITPVSAAAR